MFIYLNRIVKADEVSNEFVDDVVNKFEKFTLDDDKKITFSIQYEKLTSLIYERTMKEAGLTLIDKEINESYNNSVSFLIKKIGGNLLKGKSIMNVSLPVSIFDTRTLLQV